MNLGEIRKQFVQLSGRSDLVKDTTSWEDNGADFFINAGQRLLDWLQDTTHTKAWHYERLVPGDFILRLELFRSIDEIWIAGEGDDGEVTRVPLVKKDLKWIQDNYASSSVTFLDCVAEVALTNIAYVPPTAPTTATKLWITIIDPTRSLTVGSLAIVGTDAEGRDQTETVACATGGLYYSLKIWLTVASITASTFDVLSGDETIQVEYQGTQSEGFPSYFSRIPIGCSPQLIGTATGSMLSMYDWSRLYQVGNILSSAPTFDGVLLTPCADKVYTAEVLANFYTKNLTLDADASYWSEYAPQTLLKAALAELEGFYRNTEGRNDYMRLISDDLRGVDKDLTLDEDTTDGQMESSWDES